MQNKYINNEKILLENVYLKKKMGKTYLMQTSLKEKIQELQEDNHKLFKENLEITMNLSNLDSELFQNINKKYMESAKENLQFMIGDSNFLHSLSPDKQEKLKKLIHNFNISDIPMFQLQKSSTSLISNLSEIFKKMLINEN